MSNRTYLYNLSKAISDPDLLYKNLSERGNSFVEIGEAAYRLPLPWLCCFNKNDFQRVKVPLEERYENAELQPANSIELSLPCTSVADAIKNLSSARPLFERLADNAKIGVGFWQDALERLHSLPLPYVAMNPIEVLFMDDPVKESKRLEKACAGDETELINFACFDQGVKPYPRDVLYEAGGNADQERLSNTVALDIGWAENWHLSADDKQPVSKISEIIFTCQPNLHNINAELSALIKTRAESAQLSYGFLPTGPGQAEQLKVRVGAASDAEVKLLLRDENMRKCLEDDLGGKLDTYCKEYGFSWLGYVFISDESVDRQAKGDRGEYSKIYDEWINLPITPPWKKSFFEKLRPRLPW